VRAKYVLKETKRKKENGREEEKVIFEQTTPVLQYINKMKQTIEKEPSSIFMRAAQDEAIPLHSCNTGLISAWGSRPIRT
jgi:hemerythrin-like domain-containing protein